ncbi:glutaredoxin domain-containing cysteine-rich protein CG31559 isoform X2 [Amyelois transitella]|uniref:glutaredoxin domain-containing cysteine-rich protein CG31559 isoform X1 n=1 Tax=Amyelois transitella TaxID=680683 RepID=UPI00067B9D26|nr:glutaredoxin domain-containing cysteine-rich protein CG31559 isoform X1 [Amyelois transitella]XP_060806308.1 glutaredoxin domain-containing cysteine-rich protein CG31559 isoform X2 [Amyelois transitella]
MEGVTSRPTLEYIPPLPPKQRNSTTFTQITNEKINGHDTIDGRSSVDSLSSMHSLVLNSKSSSATVFIAANQPDRPASTPSSDAPLNGPHVVTIRINTDSDKPKAPKISSVHLKSDINFETFKLHERKNNSLVRINVDETRPKILENEEITKTDKAPYIYCNSYVNSMTNMVMSSGQCSPSDTLDSGTCSDLDGTPPPLPKKKTLKSSNKKAVSVTMISSRNGSSQSEVDFEDNDSNISCDSLNSSELNGSVHADESHIEYAMKKEKKQVVEPPIAPEMPPMVSFTKTTKDNSFLPQGLLQDIRDRSAKLSTIETESEEHEANQNINENANISKESAQLTSFRLVSQLNSGTKKNDGIESLPANSCKTPLISESTYEERKNQDKIKQEKMCYSSHYFDTDKFYDFHLNEKQFDEQAPVKSVSVSAKRDCDGSEVEYFAGIKDYKNEEAPSTIRSSKGTIRGVKNRVRAGIATFLQMQSTTKSYKEKDAGKVVLYTTTMGIVRSTYQRCVLVKKILRNLLVKYEERDVFMSTEYQDEIRDRMRSDQILVPQLFVEGHHIGDADTVEKLNESGELRKMLKPYKSPDACHTCQVCGGFRLLPCKICNGSKKSLHRNHFTAEFVALKCMNCDEVGLVRCEACS